MNSNIFHRPLTTVWLFMFVCCIRAIGTAQTEEPLRPLNICEATKERDKFDGKKVILSGRYYLGPSVSGDAPALLEDLSKCDNVLTGGIKGGFVEFHYSNILRSEKSELFLKYINDLIPNPCPPRMGCLPTEIARYEYVDIIVVGKFIVANGPFGGRHCILKAEDILSMNLGPLIDTKSLMEERQLMVNVRKITTKALLENATKKVEPSIPSNFGTIDTKISVTVIVDPKGTVIFAWAYAEKPNLALRRLCEEAARKWQFKPFMKKPFLGKEKPVAVSGVIVFNIKM